MKKRDETTPVSKRVFGAVLLCAIVVFATVAISSSWQFRDYEVADCVEYAQGLNGLVADEIDPALVDEYLAKGHEAPGYDEIRARLFRLRDAFPDVEYLYVYQIRPDGCHVVFDLDTDEVPADEPGDVLAFDPSFEGYLDELLAGKEVEPVISNDTFGYLLTVYTPLYDSDGNCKCYVAVDFLMGEIDEYVNRVLLSVAAVSAVFIVGFLIVGYFVTERRIVRPMERVEDQAYRDALTGVQNKAAFEERSRLLDKAIEDGRAVFGILMLDVNFLKRINDVHGHERGDEYLCTCCNLMCEVFGSERVYRYGGDEFVVVMEGSELVQTSDLAYDFRKAVRLQALDSSLEEWERISVALGMAIYDAEADESVSDVLKRADADMYEAKKAMKAERTD